MTSRQVVNARRDNRVVSLPSNFQAKAKGDATGALSWLFMRGFGFTAEDGMAVITKVMADKKYHLIMAFCVAGMQVRQVLMAAGEDVLGIRGYLDFLIILGRDGVADQYNFSAFHLMGQICFNCALSNDIGRKAVARVGNAITGTPMVETLAGNINLDIAKSLTAESRMNVQSFSLSVTGVEVGKLVGAAPAASAKFATSLGTA